MSPLDFLLEPLQFEFMQRALLATIAAAVICALLSCWLVLIGWSLMGDAVSHAVLPGVVIAYMIGWPFAVGALVFGFLATALIGTISSTSKTKEDASIGIVFSTLFALGIVLISITPSQTDLNHILFGNVLGVSQTDLWQIIGLTLAATAVLLTQRRKLVLWAFDPQLAQALGLSTRRLRLLLLAVLAVTCVVALNIVGVILVVAMLIIPGATAHLMTNSFRRMLVLAPSLAVVCSIVGIYISYWADLSPGGMIVLSQGALYGLVYLFYPDSGVVARAVTDSKKR